MSSRILAIAATWLVTAMVVVSGARQLRVQVRDQIVRRDAAMLWALARTPQAGEEGDSLLATEPFAVFMALGRFDGLLAARLFDADGRFQASIPDRVQESQVGDEDLRMLRQGFPVSRFRPELALGDLFLPDPASLGIVPGGTLPAVEVLVPLGLGQGQGEGIRGVAGFVLDGRAVAREFELLDRRLIRQTAVVLVVALGATGAVLVWAFRELARGHRLLQARTEDLQRANQELSQAARAAALGAVSAHLIHGLRNPVSGLQSFVAGGPESPAADAEAWREAQAATRRMQALIDRVVRVLREHGSDLSFEATLGEVGETVLAQARPYAVRRGVVLEAGPYPSASIDNRSAGLFALVLTNLLENAVEATSPPGRVRLELGVDGEGVFGEVADEGPGLLSGVIDRLFQPKQSTKEGGSGLGLAISRQLALALGGDVRLVATGPTGTRFRVCFPHRPASTSGTLQPRSTRAEPAEPANPERTRRP